MFSYYLEKVNPISLFMSFTLLDRNGQVRSPGFGLVFIRFILNFHRSPDITSISLIRRSMILETANITFHSDLNCKQSILQKFISKLFAIQNFSISVKIVDIWILKKWIWRAMNFSRFQIISLCKFQVNRSTRSREALEACFSASSAAITLIFTQRNNLKFDKIHSS